MKLALSCRIAESSSRKDVAALPIDELIPLAHAAGFAGLSMRASAVSVDAPMQRMRDVRALLDENGLEVSMVMGNVALAANNAQAPDCLRNITPHLNLAETLGAKLVRVMMQHEDDFAHARRAADEAAERGITLAHQMHWGTLCETVEQTIEVVRKMNHRHFGVTFEPANLLACGEPYGPEAIRRLAPWLVNFYFQNVCLDAQGTHTFTTRVRGPVVLRYVPLNDISGIDVRPLIGALREVGYDGWVSVHQPLLNGQTVHAAVEEAARVFGPLLSEES
ncbi:MAG: sugar phosphate isomerase/epimerase [Gammaproteobacteria bacterium]|jgi:sugar phosphate isomerase/epimerase